MSYASGDGENVAIGGGRVRGALRPADKSRRLANSGGIGGSGATGEVSGGSRRRLEETHAAVREVGEQQRVGQRAVAQAAATKHLASAVAVGLVERRARRHALHEAHRAERPVDSRATNY